MLDCLRANRAHTIALSSGNPQLSLPAVMQITAIATVGSVAVGGSFGCLDKSVDGIQHAVSVRFWNQRRTSYQ